MKIYVGWDSREDISYQVCEHSIKRRDPSAEVIPLKQNDMRSQGIYTREKDKLASTEFTFTRFFIPYLNDYKGWAVFCDCDFVWRVSPTELEQYCDDSKAVVCVQHDYKPKEGLKTGISGSGMVGIQGIVFSSETTIPVTNSTTTTAKIHLPANALILDIGMVTTTKIDAATSSDVTLSFGTSSGGAEIIVTAFGASTLLYVIPSGTLYPSVNNLK